MLVAVASSASSHYSDIEVIASDRAGVSFAMTLSDPVAYMCVNAADSSVELVRTVVIGVPPGTVPELTSVFVSRARAVPLSLAGVHMQSSPVGAKIVGIRMVRGRRIATVALYPFYQGMLYGRIEATLAFRRIAGVSADDTYAGSDPMFDAIFGHGVLNYDALRSWPIETALTALMKPAESAFSNADTWYKIAIADQGLIRVTGQELSAAGISLSGLKSDSLHLFYGGGRPLDILNDRPRPDFVEQAIMVFDGGDGNFNYSDYFLFYGEDVDRWHYPADSEPVYINNPYTSANSYWLAVSGDFATGGKRMATYTETAPADTSISQVWFETRFEKDSILYSDNNSVNSDWYTWYWTTRSPFTFYGSLPTAVAGSNAEVHLRLKAGNPMSLLVNGFSATQTYSGYWDQTFTTTHVQAGLNAFRITANDAFDSPPHLDYAECFYQGHLAPSYNELVFAIRDVAGVAEFVIEDDFSSDPYVIDLSDPATARLIDGVESGSGVITFRARLQESGNRYFLASPDKVYAPIDITSYQPANLRNMVERADLLIVAHDEFTAYLEEYAAYREEHSGIEVKLVSVGQVMNEFAYGLYDPAAIRDYFKFAYEQYPSPKPSAALLVGDGIYDFQNHLGTPARNFIPPFITAYDSLASDDNYVYFGTIGYLDSDPLEYPGFDMVIGRWPVRSIAELMTIEDKVRNYEASTNYGSWRATVTLVADDEIGAYQTESFHVQQTERLEKEYLPRRYFRNKIYLWDYDRNSSGLKPEVNEAIIESFNDGTLVINFVGHGNPDTWAHEHVFNKGSDIPQLKNTDRLTLVFTASCSIGFFDDPQREGMAEELVRYAGGGAIASVAATRLVYSSENSEFNRMTYEYLFGEDPLTICQAVYAAKLARQPERNDRAYIFFGDPLLHLGTPHYEIRFTDAPDTLTALQQHQVAGEVVGGDGNPVAFDGSVEITVYDSEVLKAYEVGNVTTEYALAGPRIFRGSADVTDGVFGFTFIAPLDIGYGGQGARISAYAQSTAADALGLADSLVIDTTITVTTDNEGPEIVYSFAGRDNFMSGDYLLPGETMILDIFDSSGINLTGGAGHALTLTIDNQVENIINLTDLYEYNAGSFTGGRITYPLGDLSAGQHVFKIKAWDNANNSSTVEFGAVINAENRLFMTDLLNYPNPMHDQTTFSCYLSSPAHRLRLEIFTLSGKRIKHYDRYSVPSGYQEFYTWDGHDDDLDRVATGTYIYKASALSSGTRDAVEAFGKVVVIN
ncbi:MAG: type IX secretion system sortase PorU [candidate division Zixibacteria bacterium]|nr:type IX secretion system sortase PorU [candidate division Zixibacteria bacterium]